MSISARNVLLRRLPVCAQQQLLVELRSAGAAPTHLCGSAATTAAADIETAAAPLRVLSSFMGHSSLNGKAAERELERRVEQVWRESACLRHANDRLSSAFQSALARIVRRTSLAQTLKGVVTAGGARAAQYAFAKISKRMGR